MASLARKNLLEDIPRFLIAQAGIVFAVTLVTVQMGIFRGFLKSTALIPEESQADIWISSEEMVYFELTPSLPVELLFQAREVEGVALAEPLLLPPGQWNGPGGTIAPLRLIGFDPGGELFTPWNLTEGSLAQLQTPYTIIVDDSQLDALNLPGLGGRGTINSLPAEVVGITEGTQSIASSVFVFTSLETANTYATTGIGTSVNCQVDGDGNMACTNTYQREPRTSPEPSDAPPAPSPLRRSDALTHILIRAEAGEDLQVLKQRLNESLPGTQAFTSQELAQRTRDYWQNRTGIGFVLGFGAGLGVVVGIAIVGQILYSSVSDRLKEFGTLKAMGASDWVLYRVIIEQALWMAVLGYLPGMALCLGLSQWVSSSMGIIILITPASAAGIFLLTTVMCVGSGFFAIQKVTRVDPAIVFKA
ncbi:FtsX-like permease family protein [Geitlerinema sp. P-1104]|uniref:FtsX-like permease family protein n=1 Tax=Geitlerinema sp. P-1104 TaxID=2546230 RepID=UPI001476CAFB|nr:FtsX-like permease family protein [Geitlerinema sp. P-1104]NMG57719.1 FtsX-like permease family protein [Geitlerinema sp. P-1104]